jgi:hypothetical protein
VREPRLNAFIFHSYTSAVPEELHLMPHVSSPTASAATAAADRAGGGAPAAEKGDSSSGDYGNKTKKIFDGKQYRKLCSVDVCTNIAQKGGVCIRHGAKITRQLCSIEECSNIAVRGGVCKKHGAKKLCSTEGCPNQAKNGGVCIKHGAKVKICSEEGCKSQVRQGGVCYKHGAGKGDDGNKLKKKEDWRKYRKKCSADGCTTFARTGFEVCMKHGAKVDYKRCGNEDCNNIAVKGGVCVKHGAKVLKQSAVLTSGGPSDTSSPTGKTSGDEDLERKKADMTNHLAAAVKEARGKAPNGVLPQGMYRELHQKALEEFGLQNTNVKVKYDTIRQRISRGNITPATKKRKRESSGKDDGDNNVKKRDWRKYRKICSADGCTTLAICGFEVCIKHGATYTKKRCIIEGCTKQAQKGGICIRHGATWTKKQCSSEGCTKQAQNGCGVCVQHGAKRKECSSEGCPNKAVKGGVCMKHGAKVKRCSIEECSNFAKKRGLCYKHGAKVPALPPLCGIIHDETTLPDNTADTSSSTASTAAAGAGKAAKAASAPAVKKRKVDSSSINDGNKSKKRDWKKYKQICSADGCTTFARSGGVCVKHGAKKGQRKLCSIEGCKTQARNGGLCQKHINAAVQAELGW